MEKIKKGHRYQLLVIIFMIAIQYVIAYLFAYLKYTPDIVAQIVISQYIIFGFIIITYLVITKSPVLSTFRFKKIKIKEAIVCFAIGIFIGPLLNFINIVSQFFVTNQISTSMMEIINLPFPVVLILIAVTPAFFEEILTRAIIIDNYKHLSVLTTCLMSGFFFGFVHMNFNQFLYATVMGMIMCYVVIVTESIFSSMIIHFTVNATTVVFMFISKAIAEAFYEGGMKSEAFQNQAANTDTSQLIFFSIFMFIAMLIFTPLAGLMIQQLLYYHNKAFKGSLKQRTETFMRLTSQRSENDTNILENTPNKKSRIITPTYIITIILFIGFAVLSEYLSK